MSCVTPQGEKCIPRSDHSVGDVWKACYEWAGSDESRWRMLTVLALLESADWSYRMVARSQGVSLGRIGQIAAQARSELSEVFG